MPYATSNPPRLMVPSIGNSPAWWQYVSADAEAAVDDAGYITNASALGMKVGDVVFVRDTANNLFYVTHVKTITNGAASLFEASTFSGA